MRRGLPTAGLAALTALAVATLQPTSTRAGEAAAALAEAIGPAEARRAIDGVATVARGEGPNGAFVTEIVALADGRTRFAQSAGDRRTELLAVGAAAFAVGAGSAASPAPREALEIARGHAVHRLLLDLDRYAVAGPADGRGCTPMRGHGEMPFSVCVPPGEELPARLLLELKAPEAGSAIEVELADWRPRLGVRLPFRVTFVQEGRRYAHRFDSVLPFRLSPGTALPEEPAALAARLADLGALAAAHEEVLAAHRASDVERLLAGGGAASLDAHRGILSVTGPDVMRARLGPYLAATRFSRYEDVAVPAIAVALDGSLGWLGCQIEAEGVQRDGRGIEEPLAFGFTWVELYARRAGRWQAVGNASSPRP